MAAKASKLLVPARPTLLQKQLALVSPYNMDSQNEYSMKASCPHLTTVSRRMFRAQSIDSEDEL